MIRIKKYFLKLLRTETAPTPSSPAQVYDLEPVNTYQPLIKGDIVEIFISANGDDNNSGFTESEPIQTLEKGFEIMQEYGFSSVHFYFLTATNFYMTDFKNITGCSIHFHTRADGVNLHIVQNATATKHEYDYTAFYGNHFNFGNTRKLTAGDNFNITQKMNVVFHSNERGSYFEGCTTIFNACRLYSNDLDHLNSNDFYSYPSPANGLKDHANYTAFVGGSVQFNQCWIYDELRFEECQAHIRNCSFYIRKNSETFINARNSHILFRMDRNDNFEPSWEGANAYAVRFNNDRIGVDNAFNRVTNAVIYGLNSKIAFYDGLGAFIAGADKGSTPYINRFVSLRSSELTADVRRFGSQGESPISQLNNYNVGQGTHQTVVDNWQNNSSVNGVYQNNLIGNLGSE